MADFEGGKELDLENENVSLGELGSLRLENKEFQLAREKLVKKLNKKKNELEIERTNANTLRQLIQELNRKVELLERDKGSETLSVINPPVIDLVPGLTGEIVERLVIEKTGLESSLEEQKTEIETLNTRLVLTNKKLEIARRDNDRFEKLVPELKLKLSKMEIECKRMSMSTNSDDNTIETLKTRVQDLSITNKHYLSQLQKKDLTIATTTNNETEKQQILERSRLEIEELKQNVTNLNELIKTQRELSERDIEELADKDSRIYEFNQEVIEPIKKPATRSTLFNPKLNEKETSEGATDKESITKLVLHANKTGIPPTKLNFRGVRINVVKLKSFPNPTEFCNKQVICLINKNNELGKLKCIAELQTIQGLKKTRRYAGIKLYNPVGNCDGTYKDKKHFDCPPKFGIFVSLEDVYVPVK